MKISYDELRTRLRSAAGALFANADEAYIEEVYDDYCITGVYPKPNALSSYPAPGHWKLVYAVDEEDNVTISGDPEQVERVTGWVAFAHRTPGVEMGFADYGSYTWETVGDTYAIRNLPVFKLGLHQGFPFDADWADLTISQHEKFEDEDGYVPTLIKGHNKMSDDDEDERGDEKPSFGLWRNLRHDGEVIYTDLEGIDAPTFQEIQAGRWPYRSVEVRPEDHRFTALALLGGTPPYHKFPPLAFTPREGAMWFSLDPGSMEVIEMRGVHFNEGGGGGAKSTEDPARAGGEGTSQTYTQEDLDAAVASARGEVEQQFSEERQAGEQRLGRLEEQNRAGRVEKFTRRLTDLGFAPGVVVAPEVTTFAEHFSRSQDTLTFAEGNEAAGIDAFDKLVTFFADTAKEGGLLAPELGMQANVDGGQHPDDAAAAAGSTPTPTAEEAKLFGEKVDPDTLLEYRFTKRVAVAKDISFEDASSLVRIGAIGVEDMKALEEQGK